MFFFGGVREYGRVERCDDTWVSSHFVHANFCPLFPLRSTLHSATGQAREIPLHLTSVVAGYLRTYPFVLLLVGALVPGLSSFARVAMIAMASLVLLAGFFVLGRLSEDEAAKRRVFSEYVGAPIDPRWIKGELPTIRQSLRDVWGETAAQLGARGYRGGTELENALVTDDVAALRLAFALARVERALASGRERERFSALEASLWERLCEVDAYTGSRALDDSSTSARGVGRGGAGGMS